MYPWHPSQYIHLPHPLMPRKSLLTVHAPVPTAVATCPNISICPLPSCSTPPSLLFVAFVPIYPRTLVLCLVPHVPDLSECPPLSLHSSSPLVHATCPDISNCPSLPFPCLVHSSHKPSRQTFPATFPPVPLVPIYPLTVSLLAVRVRSNRIPQQSWGVEQLLQ